MVRFASPYQKENPMIRAIQSLNSKTLRSNGPLMATIWTWFRITRERRALHKLDAHLLRDIGLSRDAADIEADRMFWDAPNHWRDQR
jgi:uncharacterized protein YjiS (DUF1127 family)